MDGCVHFYTISISLRRRALYNYVAKLKSQDKHDNGNFSYLNDRLKRNTLYIKIKKDLMVSFLTSQPP